MIYKPSSGRMWDPSVLWHDGKYYMFAMHDPGRGNCNVWGAVSDDGVHWRDLGPVVENAPFCVWKMFVFRCGERFIMNHGSFSRPGSSNDTIRFWESRDLVHWAYLGEEFDSRPDQRWYTQERWDHMYTIPKEDGSGYWGYCVGFPCGMLQSPDGVRWEVLSPVNIDWGDRPTGWFEHSGCEKIGGRYYLIGGIAGYMDHWSYSVWTLVADNPRGPFRPDKEAYRLCGSSGQENVWGVQFLAAMARGNNELLVSNYIDMGGPNVWMVPLKKAVVDAQGHLRLAYWPGNEQAKGAPIALDLAASRVEFATPAEQGASAEPSLRPLPRGLVVASAAYGRWGYLHDARMLALLEPTFDLDRGAILEGTLRVADQPRSRPIYAGLVIESAPGQGRATLLEAGHAACRSSHIGQARWEGGRWQFESLDVTGPGCATVTGVDLGAEHRFRLWIRQGMLELYVDDRLMQTFVTGATTGRLGLVAQNAQVEFDRLAAWEMNV